MRRAIQRMKGCFGLGLAATASLLACSLEITAPMQAPPEIWDPALNTHPNSAEFQELLSDYVHQGLPGAVLLIRTPEGQWNGAAGYAKLETSDPMLPTHRHFAASVTKMYTATAVMILAEQGLIDLDAGIGRYLPSAIYGRIPNGAQSTVRHLLGHSSGIPDFSDAFEYDLDTLNDPMGSYPPDRLLGYVEGQSPIFAPGSGYFYSNTNYLLLALLMDHVTGASHADVISGSILAPLGLDGTYYKNEPGYPRPPGLVNSYQDLPGGGRLMNVSDMVVHFTQMFIGNTGLIASSADFAEFIEALFDGRIISQESLSQMKTSAHSPRYGLGLSIVQTAYGPGFGHGGGDLGIRSEVRHFPDFEATFVLLSNGGDGGIPGSLFDGLWNAALRAALGDPSTRL